MTSETSANPDRPTEAWPVSAYQRDVLGLALRLAPEPVAQQTYSLRMDEPLDIGRLRACWRRALMSDEALRLRFAFDNGEFRQWISDEIPRVEVVDLTGAPDPEAAVQEWLWREVGAPERPDRPARLAAVVDRPDRFFLFISVHHALADGYGMNLVIATLDTSYKMKDVPPDQLAVPEPVNEHTDRSVATYRRIIEDDEAYRASEQYTADRDGLLAALDGVEPALFPNRTSAARIARGHYNTMISGEYLDRVRATGVTVFAYLTAAVATYLATIHRTDQVVIGVPMLNRHSAETYRTQGHRANVIPLPVRVERDVPLARIAEQVTQQIRKLKKHQRFPYGELTRALNPDPVAPPLYDVAFSHTKLPDADYVHELISKWTVHNPGSVTNALTIVTAENGRDGSISLQLFYDTDIFDASFPIESALRSVAEMVTASLDHPQTPVGALPLLSEPTSAEVSTFEAGPRIEFPYTTIDRLFNEQAAAHPDRVAIVPAAGSGERWLTYGQLSGLVDGFAAKLHELGATGNECIPVILPRTTDMVIAVLGILRAGCAYVPLDPDYPAARIETVLADCEARFVVAGREHARLYADLGVTRVTVADTLPGIVENVSHPADLSYLIYTSGSTGVPKGVMIEHRSVVNRLTWMQRRYPLAADDVILQKTPVTFDVSVWELFWWAITGAEVALLEVGGERDPRRIAEAIEANSVTVVHFVPSMLAAFVDELTADRTIVPRIAGLRRVFCSGEALPPALVRRFHAAFAAVQQQPPRLVNLYGPTEATVDVSYFDCPAASDCLQVTRNNQHDSLDVVPIGRPIDNIDLLVLDESGRRMPIGVPGELNIAGVGVARGYRGRPELTAAAFVDDLTVPGRRRYRTGDLARWLADGTLEYLGRFDDQVKIRGNRITLGEVENAILGCHGVRGAAVLDEQSQTHGAHLVGYFVGDAVTGDEIAEQIATRLPRYMIPTRLLRVDRIPSTRNGKADRKALTRQAAAADHAVAAAVEPRTPVEAELAQVWRTVLGIDSIGVHDNFFTHGGDSILALSVRTAAERAGMFFDVDAFYEHPTIAELARIVSDGPDGERIRIATTLETVPLIDRAALHQAEDAFPANALQLGMLFHSIERADSVTYKDVFRYRLDMPWDAAQFRAAFDRLVRRQPALRSSFELSKYSVPLQVVHTAVDYEVEIVDLTDIDQVLADQEVEDYIQERRHAPYDLTRAPLHALCVFLQSAESAGRTVDLVFSFHHAILDGWSVATSVLELLLDYLNKLGLLQTGLAAAPHSATVLAEYAQAEIAAAHDDSARAFWRDTLAGAEPTALTALGVHEGVVAREPQARALVPRRLAERITAFAARHQVPEKAVYLAAHCLTLRTVTGRADITTGVVSHGRPDRAGAESIAGLFLNTLPMRLDDTAVTWRAAVDQVARREREAYPHRRYPLRSILADGGPVFETAFNFINYHLFAPIVGADGVALRDFDVREDTNFQLLVTVANDPRDGRMWVRVNGDHTLTRDQCETVAITQLRMLASIVADPDAAIDRSAGPLTARDVGTLVAEAAALNPDTIAVRGDESSMTYNELIERCGRLVRRLSGFGIRPGDRIGILMSRRPELVLLVLALMRIGAACVPLDVSYPRARLNLMIDRARPHRVIADADYAEIVDNAALVLDTAALFDPTVGHAQGVVPDQVSPDAIAYVLFTSGSTGEPKGVAMPHRGLTSLVDWQNRSPSGIDLASTLQLAPLSFDVSFQEIFTTLAAGSTLRVSSADLRANVEELLNTVVDEGIERLFLPYVALQAFAEAVVARRMFPVNLKVLASSGEQLRITDEIRALCKVVPGLLLENQYGPTESHVATTFTLTGSPDDYPALPPVGRAVDGDTVELLDGALRPVADGVIGEIYLGGRSIASGYQGRAALTAQRFVATHGGAILYRTGDLGVRLAAGDIVCLGRSDSQVKIRGFRVEPAEVELCILGLVERYPAVTEAAVVARGFGGIDGALIAFLVGDAEQTDLAALRHDLRGVLPAHMVPSRFVFLDELPRTPSGKRDDRALRCIVEAAPESVATQREPADEYEQSAAALLAEYAGLRSIGLDDDFFAAGGTSIGAMRVVMGLSRRFGVEVPLDSFIGAPTAAELAALIRSGDTHRTYDPVVPISVGGDKPPLFLVHPIGGNVLCYLALARHLDPDRAVYGLQAAGADPGSTPEKSIIAMAESYLAAVRRVHPQGPYHLAGWSFGGNVALEMARQLPEHEVASVTLLDTMALRQQARELIAEEQLIRWFFLELLWYARGNQAALVDFEPDVHGSEALFDAMLTEAIRSGILPTDSSPQAIRRLYDVFYANYTALLEYRLEPYDRDITLLRAEEGLPPGVDIAHQAVGSMFDSGNNGWRQYAARRFTLVSVPGDHLHMMTEPHVGAVAMQLDAALAAADPSMDRELDAEMLDA
ncbi:amino acid adenylation domain-containing protein [Nocardia sp. NBC_00565]|uniref:amino acid adenylation domain-containing protein n=1 Tax=Nocardia sp. NBC_00565 TaxID=2975993 RepID=UPI002E821762|nr:amino acid adenylation domain-containing protein [Nocardia sp. NBC_00565]WUC04238.1 amino acid adenylation domain-containing protein [Nocardia sp. NBC_00565]